MEVTGFIVVSTLAFISIYMLFPSSAIDSTTTFERVLNGASRLWIVKKTNSLDSWNTVSIMAKQYLCQKMRYCTQDMARGFVFLVVIVFSVLISVLFNTLLGLLIGPILSSALIWFIGRKYQARLSSQLSQTMPEVFRCMSQSLASGRSLTQSIEYVGLNYKGKVGDEFIRCAMNIRCGKSIKQSLDELAQRLDAPGVQMLVCGLNISQKTGSPLKDLFEKMALLVESQTSLQKMLDVKTAQVKMSVKIVCTMPLILLLLLSLISVDFRYSLTSKSGIICIAIALCLDGLAIFIIKKMVGGVLR